MMIDVRPAVSLCSASWMMSSVPVVDGRCGFVQHEDFRVRCQDASEREQLLLALGEIVAAFGELRVVAVGQVADEGVCVHHLGGQIARSSVMSGLFREMLSSTEPEKMWKSCNTTPTRLRKSWLAMRFTSNAV